MDLGCPNLPLWGAGKLSGRAPVLPRTSAPVLPRTTARGHGHGGTISGRHGHDTGTARGTTGQAAVSATPADTGTRARLAARRPIAAHGHHGTRYGGTTRAHGTPARHGAPRARDTGHGGTARHHPAPRHTGARHTGTARHGTTGARLEHGHTGAPRSHGPTGARLPGVVTTPADTGAPRALDTGHRTGTR